MTTNHQKLSGGYEGSAQEYLVIAIWLNERNQLVSCVLKN